MINLPPSIVGRSIRVLVGESVWEDAVATIHENSLFIEFEAYDLDDIMIDLKELQ